MNMTKNQPQVVEIDPKEMMWDLLSQWKAVLLTSILMALILCGAKYSSDMKNYNAQIASQKDAAKQSALSVEEIVEQTINSLPEGERDAVEYVVNEQKWIDEQKNYLNTSILMNTDPTNQRVLKMVYEVDSADENDKGWIINTLTNYLSSEDVISKIKPYIAENVDDKYIGELYYEDEIERPDSAIRINLILPEETDADAVSKAINEAMAEQVKTMLSKHEFAISLVGTEVVHTYHMKNVQNRIAMFNNVNTLEGNIKTLQNSLSDSQKAAINTIVTTMRDERSDAGAGAADSDNSEAPTRPGLSKRYGLVGFVLGFLMYIAVYIITIIMQNRLRFAESVERYTNLKLLGEIYYEKKRSLLEKLFHSIFVEKYRYKGKTNIPAQIEKTADSIKAVCKHYGVGEVTLIKMIEESDTAEVKGILQDMLSAIREKNLVVKVVDETDDFYGKELLDEALVAPIVCPCTKASDLGKLLSTCDAFDIDMAGSVYLSAK